MFRTKFPLILIITLVTTVPLFAAGCSPFFFQKWNNDFHLRPTETGDTLSIGSVCATDSALFVNDQAARAMVVINGKGKVVSRIPLEGIGRGTYSGDDFIMRDDMFVFVNTVDKNLEYFDRATGKHLRSTPLPVTVLAAQPKRSDRLMDRIFLADNGILIGNGNLLFDLEAGLTKTASEIKLLKAPAGSRYALVTGKNLFMARGTVLADSTTRIKIAIPASHYTIAGKRFCVLNNRLFSVIASKEGCRIIDCGPVKTKK